MNNLKNHLVGDEIIIEITSSIQHCVFDLDSLRTSIYSFCIGNNSNKMDFELGGIEVNLSQRGRETEIYTNQEYQGTFKTGRELFDFLDENIDSLIEEYS